MSDKITITTEKDGRTIVFEGSGTLTLTERAGGWVETRPTSMSRDVHGVEIEWDGDYTIREADRQPDTLGALKAAWEAAEEADECRKGDVLIRQDDYETYGDYAGYVVYRAVVDGSLTRSRILSRAPREPWQDLADVLGSFAIHDHDGKEYPDVLAQRLYERGVRVTGGDES